MSQELDYARNPRTTYLKWGVLYVIFFTLLAIIFLLVAGRIHTYSAAQGSFELSLPYAKYLVGEPIIFTFKNNFNSSVYVTDDCPNEPLAVYKLEGTTWVRIHDVALSDSCANKDRQIVIPAGGQRVGDFSAWKNLFATPGKYRIVAYVEYFDAMPYQDFEVIAKPTPAVATPSPTTTPTNTNTNENTTPAPTTTTTPTTTYRDGESGDD